MAEARRDEDPGTTVARTSRVPNRTGEGGGTIQKTLTFEGDCLAAKDARRLFQIVAMVKPFRAQAVLAALETIDIVGGTVREAMGYGRQKNRLHRYLGSEYNASFLPKVEITLVVHEHDVAAAVKTIVGHARTGRMGDGKILILPCLPDHLSW
jgi:nitrogen regulatory protein P-II 1